MEHKTIENYTTHVLGFPIIIKHVKMRKFRDEWIPQINWEALQDLALWALAHKPAPLTGDEIHFVRMRMNKTLKEFAALCEVASHQSIMNWERKKADITEMNRPTEILLRARILEAVPAYIWDQFESKRKTPKAAISKTLNEISKFDLKPPPSLSFSATTDDSEISQYAYA